jgi:hypothetical protein
MHHCISGCLDEHPSFLTVAMTSTNRKTKGKNSPNKVQVSNCSLDVSRIMTMKNHQHSSPVAVEGERTGEGHHQRPMAVRAVTPEMLLPAQRRPSQHDKKQALFVNNAHLACMDTKKSTCASRRRKGHSPTEDLKQLKKKRRKENVASMNTICQGEEGTVAQMPVQAEDKRSTVADCPAIRNNKLHYKSLLEEYTMLVDKGMYLQVDFGNTIESAIISIKQAVEDFFKSLPTEDDPVVVAERKELRKCAAQAKRYEEQEKLSIQKDSAEWYENFIREQYNAVGTKQKLKSIKDARKRFCKEVIRFTTSTRGGGRLFCECLFFSECPVCQLAEYIPPNLKSEIPGVRRVNLFDLKDEDDDTPSSKNFSPLENSVVALKELLYSLEFVREEQGKE